MKGNRPMLHDPYILPRVKKYLEENVDKTYVDVTEMTRALQERYPEYTRRKMGPFRALVERAYRLLSESYASGCPTSEEDDDSDGSGVEMMDRPPMNVMNNMMSSLYAKRSATPAAPKHSEAIDISSDSDSDSQPKNGHSPAVSGATKADSSNTGSSSTSLSLDQFKQQQQQRGPNKRNANSESDGGGGGGGGAGDEASRKKRKPLDPHHQTLEHELNRLQRNMFTVLEQDKETPAGGGGNTQPPKGGEFAAKFSAGRQHVPQAAASMRTAGKPAASSNGRMAGEAAASSQGAAATASSSAAASGRAAAGAGAAGRPPARKYKMEVKLRKSRETFQDVGGMEKTLKEMCEILMHVKSPDIYFGLGLMPPRGILLHGPSGCGKTLLAHAIAGQLNLHMIEVSATELIAGVSGESEERIRDLFEQAANYAPCVLFIDEIDAISSNRSFAQKDMERRIVSQLISSLDNLKTCQNGQSVLVVGATSRPDVLDPALRRVGRFDHEIAIGIPTRKDRKDIMTILCDSLSIEPQFDFDKIAELTPGYVGADILALVSRAAIIAVKRMCSVQMRQAQCNRNITIVELDDDDSEAPNMQAADSASETTRPDPEVAPEELPGDEQPIAAVVVEDEVKLAAEEDKEKKVEENPSKGSPNPGEPAPTEDDTPEVSKAEPELVDPAEPMEVQEAASESSSSVEPPAPAVIAATSEAETVGAKDKAVEKAVAGLTGKKSPPEPTLFELLTWLENPPEELAYIENVAMTFEDFREAVKVVQPSAKREGFITVPDVTWDDVGSLRDIREKLKLAVLAPVKYPKRMERLGLTAPSGVLLCGPPGCGKTLLAKAVANEAGINFISVKGPELMNMYVGESERAVRTCFQRARNSAPCVIFFDEFDSLCPKRSDSNEGGSGTRVVNQLLTEMDGVEERRGVYILAATNRPDIIDPAILRPGRLDTILYVDLPKKQDRLEILQATTKNGTRPRLGSDVVLEALADKTEGYTGADLAGLVQQAAMLALKDSLELPCPVGVEEDLEDLCVRQKHFEASLKALRPSVSPQDRKVYDKLRVKYAAPPDSVERDTAALEPQVPA